MRAGEPVISILGLLPDNGAEYLTKTNWKAECFDENQPELGLIVTSPNGVKYSMTEPMTMFGTSNGQNPPLAASTWLTNRIEDADGNFININYLTISTGLKVPVSINASDNRVVTLNFIDGAGANVGATSTSARLESISSHGQTWRYEYDELYNDLADSGWDSGLAPQLGQNPLRLQLNATRRSAWQDSQRTRRNPCSRRPQRR